MVSALPTLGISLGYDLLLVWLTARFARKPLGFGRLLAGAGVGTLPTLWDLLDHNLYALPWELSLVWPVAMLFAAFGRMSMPEFRRALLVLYGASLFAGGLGFFFSDVLPNMFASRLSPVLTLLAPAAMLFSAARWGPHSLGRSVTRWRQQTLLELSVEGRRVILPMLWDTGNQARDPVLGRPVLVVDLESVWYWLPPDVLAWVEHVGTGRLVPPPAKWQGRVGLVNFLSLGGGGQLPLMAVDDARILDEGERWRPLVPVTIGISRRPVSADGSYHALVSPECRRVESEKGVKGA